MALLTTYGKFNKVVDTELLKRYASVKVGNVYHVTRYASKNYKFVGMDYTTALRCRDALSAQYVRNQASIVNGAVVTMPVCSSDISMNHESGCGWEVGISVNETDTRIATTLEDADTYNLFAAEDARWYDDDDIVNPFDLKGFSLTSPLSERELRLYMIANGDNEFKLYVKYGMVAPWLKVSDDVHYSYNSSGEVTWYDMSFVRSEGATRIPKFIKVVSTNSATLGQESNVCSRILPNIPEGE